jgi:hypothetical protein
MHNLKRLILLSVTLFYLNACARADIPQFLEQYLWQKNILITFTPSEDYKSYVTQNNAIKSIPDFKNMNFVQIDIIASERVKIDYETKPRLFTNPFREHFNIPNDQYMVIIINKNGEEQFRTTKNVTIEQLHLKQKSSLIPNRP